MIEHGAEGIARTCLSEASSAAKMLGIVILSDPERATSSLLVLPLCRYREKNRKNLIPGLTRDLLRITLIRLRLGGRNEGNGS